MRDFIDKSKKTPIIGDIFRFAFDNGDFYFIKELFIFRIFLFGLIFLIVPQTYPFAIMLTPFMLILLAGYIFYPSFGVNLNKKMLLATIGIAVITFVIEAVGVATGFPFGNYSYGPTLGFKLFETPLIIGLNWVIVIVGTASLASNYFKNKFAIAGLAGLFAVLFDIILEPVAIKLNYWSWSDSIIPLQNYLAWFVITFMLVLAYQYFVGKVVNARAKYVMVYQVLFFVMLLLLLNS